MGGRVCTAKLSPFSGRVLTVKLWGFFSLFGPSFIGRFGFWPSSGLPLFPFGASLYRGTLAVFRPSFDGETLGFFLPVWAKFYRPIWVLAQFWATPFSLRGEFVPGNSRRFLGRVLTGKLWGFFSLFGPSFIGRFGFWPSSGLPLFHFGASLYRETLAVFRPSFDGETLGVFSLFATQLPAVADIPSSRGSGWDF